VICLAPFQQPFFFLQNDQALRRVLYAFDQPLYRDDLETGERFVFGESHATRAQKQTGVEIPLGFFTNQGMREVSAVIFSTTATFTKVRALSEGREYPVLFSALRYAAHDMHATRIAALGPAYHESLPDGLHVCLSPFADFPMDPRPFMGREIAVHAYDPKTSTYLPMVPDGFLIQHGCFSSPSREAIRKGKSRGRKQGTYKKFKLQPWPEGKLVPVGGFSGPFVDNHMAHYRGWTIVVAFDSGDKDWGGQAIPGLYRTLPQYLAANSKSAGDLILPTEWFCTKEQALNATTAEIHRHTAISKRAGR